MIHLFDDGFSDLLCILVVVPKAITPNRRQNPEPVCPRALSTLRLEHFLPLWRHNRFKDKTSIFFIYKVIKHGIDFLH